MEIERVIGRLEEQGRWTAAKLEKIEQKVDSLLQFKWKIYGMTAVIAVVFAGVCEVFLSRVIH